MTGQAAENKTKLSCPSDNCQKEYIRKQSLTNHIKSIHQSLVQGVVNYLSPQPSKDATSPVILSSQRVLFTDNDEDIADLNEAVDDQEVVRVAQRHEEIEALRVSIIPDSDFLTRTLPAGQLSDMLTHVPTKNQTSRASDKNAPPKQMTCAECVLGKEENKKQNLINKADIQAKRTLQKGFNRLTAELKECRSLLEEKTKEVVVLKQTIETKNSSDQLRSNKLNDIVEEVVKTAGDWQSCESCGVKLKGTQRLLKHQQEKHLTCTMCPENKWVGLSIAHLRIHHQNTHKVKTTNQKCDTCKLVFPDAMAKNVHDLKKHNFQCNKCNTKCSNKTSLNSHITNTHSENLEVTMMKCIVCEKGAASEAELAKHYELNHISKEDVKCTQCKETFSEKKALNSHIKDKHTISVPDKSLKCIVCEKKAENESELAKHYELNHIKSKRDSTENI